MKPKTIFKRVKPFKRSLKLKRFKDLMASGKDLNILIINSKKCDTTVVEGPEDEY